MSMSFGFPYEKKGKPFIKSRWLSRLDDFQIHTSNVSQQNPPAFPATEPGLDMVPKYFKYRYPQIH
jgi:hypothetical protein